MEPFGTLDSSEKTVAIYGGRRPAERKGDNLCLRFLERMWKIRHERSTIGDVFFQACERCSSIGMCGRSSND